MDDASKIVKLVDLVKDFDAKHANQVFWKLRLNERKIEINFLEFIVAYLQRSYEIKEDDTVNDQLIYNILNSKVCDKLRNDGNYREFIFLFLANARSSNCIKNIVTITQSIFSRIMKNSDIPQDDMIREQSALFLCFFFKPLILYYKQFASDPLNFQKVSTFEFDQNLLAIIGEFMDCFLIEGLLFENTYLTVAAEFCHAVENFPSTFIKILNKLPNYLKILAVDNICLITIALMSLNRLFLLPDYKKDLLSFYNNTYSFIDENGYEAVISISELFYQLAMAHDDVRFNEQILTLLVKIEQLNRKITYLSADQRMEIYAKKITIENENVLEKLFAMMNSYEKSSLIAMIDTLNIIHAPDNFVEEIVRKLCNIRNDFLDAIVKVIAITINENDKCFRACQIFLAYHKVHQLHVEKKIIAIIHNLLNDSISNEFVFGTFCEFLVNIQEMNFIKLLSNSKRATEIIGVVVETFNSFEKPQVLEKIMKLINRFKIYAMNYLKDHLIACRRRNYEEFIAIDAQEIAGTATELIEPTIIRLNLLFENNICFLDYFEYDASFIINRRRLENMEEFSFAHIARFQTTLLKKSFDHIIKRTNEKKDYCFPLKLEDIMKLAADLRSDKLLKVINNWEFTGESISDAAIVLTSFFELHHAFVLRPLLIDEGKRIMHIQQPRLHQKNFNYILKFIDECMKNYDQSNSWESLEKCEADYINRIINSLVVFIKNYSHHLNYSMTFRLIYHLTNEQFHDSLEDLINVLSCKSRDFPEIIGLTIMNFVHKYDTITDFLAFVLQINALILAENKSAFHFETAAFIIKAMPTFWKKFSSNNNRLTILQNLLVFIPNVLKRCNRIDLELLVSQTINGLELTTEEQNILDFFTMDIKTKEVVLTDTVKTL